MLVRPWVSLVTSSGEFAGKSLQANARQPRRAPPAVTGPDRLAETFQSKLELGLSCSGLSGGWARPVSYLHMLDIFEAGSSPSSAVAEFSSEIRKLNLRIFDPICATALEGLELGTKSAKSYKLGLTPLSAVPRSAVAPAILQPPIRTGHRGELPFWSVTF